MSSAGNTTKSTSKGSKKSAVVILRLPTDKLSQIVGITNTTSSSTSSPPSSTKIEPSPSVQPPDVVDKTSESNATPIPPNGTEETEGDSLAPPKADPKKRRSGGTATGRKRAPPAIDPDAPMRERARPGPKKKPRLADGSIDRTTDGSKAPVANPNPVPAHKLGPKANTGAINAGLRALDRSGKPCRKWERKALQFKSFTGVAWDMPSWKAPVRNSNFAGDVTSDTTGSSDMKPNGSSALPSERDGDVEMTNGIDSSPAPPVAAA